MDHPCDYIEGCKQTKGGAFKKKNWFERKNFLVSNRDKRIIKHDITSHNLK